MSQTSIEAFVRGKNYLVCVDSDGCAMDTMEVKHRKCFCPEMIRVWKLFPWEEKVTQLWYDLNLYSKTRGINRFKGLAKTFEVISGWEGVSVEGWQELLTWTEQATELSNPALEQLVAQGTASIFSKALEWSKAVNRAIANLPQEEGPFPNVKEGLEFICQKADIAVVSSANGGALDAEWNRCHLTSYLGALLGQEAGSKKYCIAELLKKGYIKENVLMVGDAPGDLQAALSNGVHFYPILVGKEDFSWERLRKEGINRLLESSYAGEYQSTLIQEFEENLR